MKYAFWFFFLTFNSFVTHSQSIALDYYANVNAAELQVARKNISAAFDDYEKAFAINTDKRFSRDLYNAFHCAMLSGHREAAALFLANLLKRGLSDKFISNSIYFNYKGEDSALITKTIKENSNSFGIKTPLSMKIEAMIEIDQSVRNYFSKIHRDGNYMVDSVYRTDQNVAKSLLQLFKSMGRLPNQNDLGNSNGYPLGPISYFIIILHNSGAGLGGYKNDYFFEMMHKAIFTFDYHPDWYARDFRLLAESKKDKKIIFKNSQTLTYPLEIGHFRAFEKDKNGNKIPYTKAEILEINKNRKKIGLEPIEEIWEKQTFMNEKKGTPYEVFYIE